MRFFILVVVILLSGCSEPEPVIVAEDVALDKNKIVNDIELPVVEDLGLKVIVTNQASESYVNKYLKATSYKAFAQSESGAWSWKSNRTSAEHAKKSALISCQANNKKNESISPCKIINIDGIWVKNS